MIHRNSALRHYLFQIAVTQRIPQVPPHAQNDDDIVKVSPSEGRGYGPAHGITLPEALEPFLQQILFEDAYSPDEQRFLSLGANQIAVAIDDARAQQRLRLLLDLTNRVVSKLDLRELLDEIAESIRHVMQCDCVGVALPDPESGQLHLYIMDFPGHEALVESKSLNETTEHVFRTGQTVNLAKDSRLAVFGLNSQCSLPLLSRGLVLGVLGLGSSREGAFLEDDVFFLGQVANQIAIAVENACTYGEVSQLKDRLAQENVYLESEIRNELLFEDIAGNSQALQRVLREVETVAPADSTVLIYGETGTGKELIARAVQPQLPEIECFREAQLCRHSHGRVGERTLRP